MRTVLIVEDDIAVRKVLSRMLRPQPLAILEAGSAAEALAVTTAHTGPIDLLLSDVILPETSGERLAEQLRQVRPGLKVIWISGYSEEVLGEHGIGASDPNFLQKPFTADALVRKIRQVLGEDGQASCAAR